MNTRLKDLRSRVDNEKGKQSQVMSDVRKLKGNIRALRKAVKNHEKAREILKLVGGQTQQQLQFHISDITSLALDAVFPDPYILEARFIERRNKMECDLFFVRDGEEMDPMDASGGGTIDIASFALRIASWSMARPNSRNTIILDEPMKNLSEEYQEQASKMIKEVSDRLGLQFIIVTHEPVLSAWADREFKTTIHNKVTKIHLK